MKVLIPYTPILQRYHALEGQSRDQRLNVARKLTPDALVRDFVDSHNQIATSYSNAYESFHGRQPRKPLPRVASGSEIATTNQLVSRIPRFGRVAVDGGSDLDFRFVEREVSVLRTKNAEFDAPTEQARSAGRALLCDLLLTNANDKTPIVGEIKVTRGQYTDKDPHSALIQALASAAHLVAPAQYGRLLHYFPRRFRRDDRRVDVYVITGSYDAHLTHLNELLQAAKALAAALTADATLSRYVRRIEFLDATPAGRQIDIRSDFG
jgi:hypothetical protein